jgi:TRAP-type C4-dicarboxylate transport system permease small subunit
MQRAHALLMRLCGGIAIITIGLITLMVCVDVVARNLRWGNLPWVTELTEYALPLATLLAAPWLMWRGQHVRLDVLEMVLSPASRARMERLSAAAGLLVSLALCGYGLVALLDSRRSGAVMLKALVFPEWWLYLPVPIGFGALALECARRLFWPPVPVESGAGT